MEFFIETISIPKIDNELYHKLGERWYTAFDDPVALLRSESKVKAPWVISRIKKLFSLPTSVKVLDVGCGGGFLSNRLAEEKFLVTGVDISEESLVVAKKYDRTASVQYLAADAYQLPFPDQSFDVVTAMDFLEHVDQPERAVKEISRVLKPGGLFFFHTFNRNWLANLVIIKVVEWLVKNTPKNMHVIEMFITPKELEKFCDNHQMKVSEMTGIRPRFSTITLSSLFTGIVPKAMAFKLTKSLMLSYMGVAKKL